MIFFEACLHILELIYCFLECHGQVPSRGATSQHVCSVKSCCHIVPGDLVTLADMQYSMLKWPKINPYETRLVNGYANCVNISTLQC